MSAIIWDVLEEHLDEAEFLAEVWHVNLDAPAYQRDEFAAGPQERLLAHVDGLVVGGEQVRTELLEPTLAEEDTERWRACAAGLALLQTPSAQVSAQLYAGLEARGDEVRAGIIDALVMSARSDVDVRLIDALKKPGDLAHRTALAQIGGQRGVDPRNHVDDLLESKDPTAMESAVSMLPFGDRRYLNWVEHCLGASEPALAAAARRAGLVMSSGPAWQQVGALGLAAEPDPEALVWLAGLADARIAQRIAGLLDDEATRPVALYALGYSGRRLAMEACLPWLGDEAVGPLAGEAFASMTGLPLDDATYWSDPAEPEEDDEELEAELGPEPDEDLEVRPEDELPIPKPEAIAAWWQQHQVRFDAKQRYVAGRPLDQASIGHALTVLPMRRHHALVFELLVRSEGQVNLRSRALTSASDGTLSALSSMPRIDGNRSYGQY